MSGPADWTRASEHLAETAHAIAEAFAAVESAHQALAIASSKLSALHADEEDLDARLAALGSIDVLELLELYRYGIRAAGLSKLWHSAREELARVSSPLVSTEAASAFTLARAYVDTVAVELESVRASYDDPDDDPDDD